jgi:hypothetical protein
MRNKYSCISVVSIRRTMFIALLVILPNLLSAQRTHSIDTDGVYDQYTVNDGIPVNNDDWIISKNSL